MTTSLRNTLILGLGATLACLPIEQVEQSGARDAGAPDACAVFGCDWLPQRNHCQEQESHPQGDEATAQFVLDNAIPTTCTRDEVQTWEFRTLQQDFEGNRLFILGEMHGTKDYPEVSAALLLHLARAGLVNKIVVETPMELTTRYQDYITTGDPSSLNDYYTDSFYTPSIFFTEDDAHVALVKAARELYLEGVELEMSGADLTYNTAWVVQEIQDLAQRAQSVSDLILADLPDGIDMLKHPERGVEFDRPYIESNKAYWQQLEHNLDQICAELDEASCIYLQALGQNLWAGSYYMGINAGLETTEQENLQMFFVREQMITQNHMLTLLENDRAVYSHYGAYHADKHRSSGAMAARLNTDWEPTRGLVFTIDWGNGPGSELRYAYDVQTIDPWPTYMAEAAADLPHERIYISYHHPAEDCVANPFPHLLLSGGVPQAQRYDGMFYFKRTYPRDNTVAVLLTPTPTAPAAQMYKTQLAELDQFGLDLVRKAAKK